MCYEKRLLEGKCNTCLQVYEGLLLLQRCWLLWALLALPFSRATDLLFPELQTLQEMDQPHLPSPATPLLTPNRVSQALLCPTPHVHTHLHSATPFHVSALSPPPPSKPQALLVTHTKLPWPGVESLSHQPLTVLSFWAPTVCQARCWPLC